MIEDIKNYSSWKNVEKISKGWSSDVKYLITAEDDQKLLLRVSDIEQYDAKKSEYEMIKKFASSGIEMNQPVDFGICNNGKSVYTLLTWIEGCDLEEALKKVPVSEQYELGVKAGKLLKKIHSIKVDEKDLPLRTKKEKFLTRLEIYENSKVRIENDENIINYIKDNIDYTCQEGPVYCHGDFHPGNLIYMPNKEIGVIDFNRWKVSDPYEEFYKLSQFGVDASIPYCVGQIDSYFEGNVPPKFWKIQTVYVAYCILTSIVWAEKFGEKDLENMKKRTLKVIEDYEDFTTDIPKWYSNYQKND